MVAGVGGGSALPPAPRSQGEFEGEVGADCDKSAVSIFSHLVSSIQQSRQRDVQSVSGVPLTKCCGRRRRSDAPTAPRMARHPRRTMALAVRQRAAVAHTSSSNTSVRGVRRMACAAAAAQLSCACCLQVTLSTGTQASASTCMPPLPADETPPLVKGAGPLIVAANNWMSSIATAHIAAIYLRRWCRTGRPVHRGGTASAACLHSSGALEVDILDVSDQDVS